MLNTKVKINDKTEQKSEKVLSNKSEKNKSEKIKSEKQPQLVASHKTPQVVTYITDKSIRVVREPEEYRYRFYNVNGHSLGTFTIPQLIKYINPESQILKHIEIGLAESLLKQYICETFETPKGIQIKLITHIESPFMGDIVKVLELYNDINRYSLIGQLSDVNNNDTKIILYNVRQLQYLLLNKILKLANYISDTIKNDNTQKELKNDLLKYSISATYKITTMIKEDLQEKIKEYNTLQNDVLRLAKIKLTIRDEFDNLKNNIEVQNKQIENIISGMTHIAMTGGNLFNSSSSTTNSSTTKSSASVESSSKDKKSDTTNTSSSSTFSSSVKSGSSDTSTIQSRNATSSKTSSSNQFSIESTNRSSESSSSSSTQIIPDFSESSSINGYYSES